MIKTLKFILLGVCLMSLLNCSGEPPKNLGVTKEKLAVCPNKPNCVSSQATSKKHLIKGFPLKASAKESIQAIKKIIKGMKRTTIVQEKDNYLYAEFQSALMGYVDDIEFYADETGKIMHVRSASRLGKSDLGANRKRVEAIRKKY
ncbi:MAG: hypothetical protein ACI86H_002313 [bacterium]|jgi:uncharacterized protein (DUF1499 family)